jgi:hypothetical protein
MELSLVSPWESQSSIQQAIVYDGDDWIPASIWRRRALSLSLTSGLGPAGHLAPDAALAVWAVAQGDGTGPALFDRIDVDRVVTVTAASRSHHGRIVNSLALQKP